MRRYVVALMLGVCSFTSLSVGHSAASPPQASKPTSFQIFVGHSGSDDVGAGLAYQLREKLRRSAGYPLTTEPRAADIVIVLVTLDQSCPGITKGSSSAASVTFYVNTAERTFMTSLIQVVGRNRIEEVAEDIVAALDHEVQRYQRETK